MLDRLEGDADQAELFQSGALLDELKRKLAERTLDAEMDMHLEQEQESENVRNGHNKKTVLTDSGSMPLKVPRDRQGLSIQHKVGRHDPSNKSGGVVYPNRFPHTIAIPSSISKILFP